MHKSNELRSQSHSRLGTALFVTEKYLTEGIFISDEMDIQSRIQASKHLEDCENLIDGIELWNTQDSEPSWGEFRSLFEEFAFQLLESDSLDLLIVKSDRTSVIPLAFNGHGFAVIHLSRNQIEDPQYWCQCTHEISHLNQDLERVKFCPHLHVPVNERYQKATKIWSGDIESGKAWFTEVLADLWSSQTVGGGYFLGFRNYRETMEVMSPTVGARSHPPSDLRITLMGRFLTTLGYSTDVIPEYTSLNSLLPILTMDDSEYGGELNGLTEIFDPIFIEEVERISKQYLESCPDNTSIIKENLKELHTSSTLRKDDLVTDVGVLAMYCYMRNDSVTQYIDELKEEYT
ncbi:MAG: hypothetical protein ACFFER_16655 [Candidatus Thorarchaeota archaeon]